MEITQARKDLISLLSCFDLDEKEIIVMMLELREEQEITHLTNLIMENPKITTDELCDEFLRMVVKQKRLQKLRNSKKV